MKYDNSTDQVFSIENRLLTMQGILNLEKDYVNFGQPSRKSYPLWVTLNARKYGTHRTCHLYIISMLGVPVQLAVQAEIDLVQ